MSYPEDVVSIEESLCPENGGGWFLRKIGSFLLDDVASRPPKQSS